MYLHVLKLLRLIATPSFAWMTLRLWESATADLQVEMLGFTTAWRSHKQRG